MAKRERKLKSRYESFETANRGRKSDNRSLMNMQKVELSSSFCQYSACLAKILGIVVLVCILRCFASSVRSTTKDVGSILQIFQ